MNRLKIGTMLTVAAVMLATPGGAEVHHKQCFYPSGGLASNIPCRNDTEASHCCAYGYFCLSNGLCKPGPHNENLYRAHFHRAGCTDQTWKSPECPNVCRGADDNLDASMGLAVCDEEAGIFCCQRDFDCCTNSTLHMSLGRGNVVRELVRPTSAETDVEHEVTDKKTHSQDMVVGVASGFSIAAGFAILGWIFILVRRRLQLKKLEAASGDDEMGRRGSNFEKAELDAVETVTDPTSSPWRVGGGRNPIEMDTGMHERSELETIHSATTTATRSGSVAFTLSPMSPGSATADYFGTLVTPMVLEMEAPESLKRHHEALRIQSSHG